MRALLRRGADVNLRDCRGATPLIHASLARGAGPAASDGGEGRHCAVARALLEATGKLGGGGTNQTSGSSKAKR